MTSDQPPSRLTSGIYKITNNINGKFYIGSSVDLRTRLREHKRQLKNNTHANKYLQNAYNKDSINKFKFEILMYCSEKDLLFYEQRFLNACFDNQKQCYNICKIVVEPQRNKKFSKERIETSTKKNKNIKLSYDIAKEIRREYIIEEKTSRELGKKYGVGYKLILQIVNNKIWIDETYIPLTKKQSIEKRNKKLRNNKKRATYKHKKQRIKGARAGQTSSLSKLTWKIVKEIREKVNNENKTYKELSKEYQISQSQIGKIIKNERWYDSSYIENINRNLLLSDIDIKNIRELHKNGVLYKEIQKRYTISLASISKIINDISITNIKKKGN